MNREKSALPAQSTDQATSLDASILDVLGEDPTKSQYAELEIHPTFLERWQHWVKKGLLNAEREKLLKKYSRSLNLEAPILNPEIVAPIGEYATKRDNFRKNTQQITGSALVALGAAITLCTKEKSIDKLDFLHWLFDAAKLISDLLHNQTQNRKAVILPGLSREVKEVLKNTTPDKFLFGENLGEKIKNAKSLEKMAPTLKIQHQPSTSRQHLNLRGPPGTRPYPRKMGNAPLAGMAKQRLIFRGKKPNFNQKVNPIFPKRGTARPTQPNPYR